MNTIDNRQAARTLFGVAALLESQGENPYRVRAYRRAALRLMRLPVQAVDLTAQNGQLLVPWLGERLRKKVGELVTQGSMEFHQALLASLPDDQRDLLEVPGVGLKTAQRLIGEAEIHSASELADAAHEGRLQALRGYGPVLERKLGEAAERTLLARSVETVDVVVQQDRAAAHQLDAA